MYTAYPLIIGLIGLSIFVILANLSFLIRYLIKRKKKMREAIYVSAAFVSLVTFVVLMMEESEIFPLGVGLLVYLVLSLTLPLIFSPK